MATRFRVSRWRIALASLATAATLIGVFPICSAAQTSAPAPAPVDLPAGPAAPGFEISRFANVANGTFVTLFVTKTEALRDVLKAGRVAAETRLLVTDTAAGKLAFVMDQMAFHHSAQGRAGNKNWLATF